jgi:hypothetical protein
MVCAHCQVCCGVLPPTQGALNVWKEALLLLDPVLQGCCSTSLKVLAQCHPLSWLGWGGEERHILRQLRASRLMQGLLHTVSGMSLRGLSQARGHASVDCGSNTVEDCTWPERQLMEGDIMWHGDTHIALVLNGFTVPCLMQICAQAQKGPGWQKRNC